MNKVSFHCDGKRMQAPAQTTVVEALKLNGEIVPTLCWTPNIEPCLGTCRVCTVKINGRETAACTQIISQDMEIESSTDELKDLRQAIVEMLFVEGNHYCPSCEKSGDCELQGLAYQMGMTHSRFPYQFTPYELDYTGEKLLLERNRCIHCKRCTDLFVDDKQRKVFSFEGKGSETRVQMNHRYEAEMSDHKRLQSMELCPVGAIIYKGKGFDRPIGTRKYDHWGEKIDV